MLEAQAGAELGKVTGARERVPEGRELSKEPRLGGVQPPPLTPLPERALHRRHQLPVPALVLLPSWRPSSSTCESGTRTPAHQPHPALLASNRGLRILAEDAQLGA